MTGNDQETAITSPAAGDHVTAIHQAIDPVASTPIPRAWEPESPVVSSAPKVARAPAIIVTVIIGAIVGLSLWYLVQPQPLIIQGEAAATCIDIAARVDGRVGKRPVSRGDNVADCCPRSTIRN